MNRLPTAIAVSLAVLASVAAANDVKVELVSGFHAEAHPAIASGSDSTSYSYNVLGGTRLTTRGGERFLFSISCTGLDRAQGSQTTGSGRCAWSDGDNDMIYVQTDTGVDGNRYTITGGSGKWANARGSIHTRFTYLPSPREHLYLGVEEGSGIISHQPGEFKR